MEHLVYNAIRTPDGTILSSRNRHDYKTHLDANGEEYMVDGGLDYIRRNVTKEPAEELSVCLEQGHDVVREACKWGTYGKTGSEPFRIVALKDMSDGHIQACLDTQAMHPNYRTAFCDEIKGRNAGTYPHISD